MKDLIIITIILLAILLGLTQWAWTDEITDIIPAIIQVESSGRAWATSKDGCRGLMQLSKLAWEDVMDIPYLSNVYNSKLNVVAGERYLRLLKRRLGEDYTLERLIASYNCGLGRLKEYKYKWWRIGETRRYIKKVQYFMKC